MLYPKSPPRCRRFRQHHHLHHLDYNLATSFFESSLKSPFGDACSGLENCAVSNAITMLKLLAIVISLDAIHV